MRAALPDAFLNAVTDLGDSAILLPLALLAGVCLTLLGWRRSAVVLALAVGATGAVIGGLKILLRGCAPILHSPSGHTALSVVTFGLLAAVFAKGLGRLPAALISLATALLVAGIAVSRVLLEAHSWQEVVAGGLVGCGILALALRRLGPEPPLRLSWLLVACLLPVVLLHGQRLPTEEMLAHLSTLLSRHPLACPTAPLVAGREERSEAKP